MITPSPAQAPDVVLGQASTFGRSLFHGVAFAGGQVIISEVLAAMGYNPNTDFNKALKEINDSIAALNDDVRKISEQVERYLRGRTALTSITPTPKRVWPPPTWIPRCVQSATGSRKICSLPSPTCPTCRP